MKGGCSKHNHSRPPKRTVRILLECILVAHTLTMFYIVLQFGHMMDSLFKSFNGSVSVTNFAELSGSIFSWLEEYCKPQVSSCLKPCSHLMSAFASNFKDGFYGNK